MACAESPPPAADSDALAGSSIFRTISIQPYGTITLGAPFTQRDEIGATVGPQTYRLVPSGFADTDSILVQMGGDGTVEQIRFVYLPGKDYTAAVTEYRASLGSPAHQSSSQEEGAQFDRVIWQDGKTQFELQRVLAAGTPDRVVASVRDLVH
jgi:hypothetical protein